MASFIATRVKTVYLPTNIVVKQSGFVHCTPHPQKNPPKKQKQNLKETLFNQNIASAQLNL